MKDTVTLKDIIEVISKSKKFIILFILIGTIVIAGITLILPVKYTATARILPPVTENRGISQLLSSGIPGAASFLNGGIGSISNTSDLFAAILKSVTIRKKIIDRYNLIKYFRSKCFTEALKALGKATTINVTQEGIVEISVTMRDKKLAADISNTYVQELDKFNKETKMTQGKKYRIFVGERLKEERKTLNQVIEKLKEYQKKHKTIDIEEETKKIINVYADLKANLIEKEIQQKAYEKISPTNPYTQYLKDEIVGIKKEVEKMESKKSSSGWGAGFGTPFNKIPDVYAEVSDLIGNVKIHQTIYEFLSQQYEQAKIQEAKDTPTVQFLDRATPPEKKSFPQRKKIVIATFIVLLIVAVLGVLTREYFIPD